MHSMQLRESDQNKPEICIDTDEETRYDDDAEGFDEGPIISFLPSLWNVANHLGNQYTQGLNGMKEVADDVVVMTTKTIGPRFIFGTMIVLVVVSDVRWEKDETRDSLNDTQCPISEPVHGLVLPHA